MNVSAIDARLPGADLVAKGIEDLANDVLSEEALLIAAAAPRLRRLGLDVRSAAVEAPLPRLYEMIASVHPHDAHARYNALIGRVASFARAAEHAASR